jgi:NTP pyrophosphatase (non-canonical NTP hydrolase)
MSNLSFQENEQLVLQWARDRNIFDVNDGSSAKAQLKKLAEEFCELDAAIYKGSKEEALDGIGDMMVVLTLIAKFLHVDLNYCYELAYSQIKDRKGKMLNGLFVKEL